MLQSELFERWRREDIAQFAGVLELETDLRPQIDKVTTDILEVLGKWDGRATVRANLGALTVEPISANAVSTALQPLIDGVTR